ncbi:HAMP domain-containing sensor histidine kinase [Vreelandella rituensis]|uniref:histidine kinase n=1 Tax=Vreelandella rituensis TaxID=2282306 RepID=A0A368TYW8_9GAMM|nr:HAMP domain-containing sensor histidine kinase [Halomonas rituensis]RCV89928.1 sensor histidine kinase [Halomonas rituensis]
MPMLTLKHRLLLLIFSVTLGVLLLAGFMSNLSLLNYHRYKAQQMIENSFEIVALDYIRLREELQHEARLLDDDINLEASLNLINIYEDRNNYKSILFDEEKLSIGARLLTAVQTGRSDQAYLFDQGSRLVAAASLWEKSWDRLYQSYQQGQAEIKSTATQPFSQEKSQEFQASLYLLEERLEVLRSSLSNGLYLIDESLQLLYRHSLNFEKETPDGHLIMLRHLDETVFSNLITAPLKYQLRTEGQTVISTMNRDLELERQLSLLQKEGQGSTAIYRTEQGFYGMRELFNDTLEPVTLVLKYPNDLYLESRNKTLKALMLAMLASAILALPLALWFLVRQVTQPIQGLVQGVKELREGKYQVAMNESSRDELGVLAQEFNSMAAEIRNREQRLERANRDLARLSEAMAHHFQEPSRRLVAYASYLENAFETGSQSDMSTAVGFIGQQARHLHLLVNKVQQYLAFQRESPALQPVALNMALETALQHSLLNATEVDVEIAPALPAVEADPEYLHEALVAVMNNAYTYRVEQRPLMIRITALRHADKVTLRVCDNGMGISLADREAVFELFTRLTPAVNAEAGTGMGLANVRQSFYQMQGEVHVEEGIEGGVCIAMSLKAASDFQDANAQGANAAVQ